MRTSSVAKLLLRPSMLCKNDPDDPYFFLHFLNIRNMITNWMKFEKFEVLILSRVPSLNIT